ncbi:hypothetical protein THAOC_32359 [Thalassiosira oceanica]|uniref:Uncharacterized protein n=1 Tax=Thalassiosira oceanica TaxID=159749 RepID=K0RQ43_THAOC|nr:hypothetical protein THAOC_32359 [Thalassiosira oceanica]|eukprot:EJK48812.1 hypothetical protein THAOC_32359 [Thalassiosira oceanica]
MCHELGHGLGLGHSDVNFHNRDLGNCMDYTEHPERNMQPDDSNFETLVDLYGPLGGESVSQHVRTGVSESGGGRELVDINQEAFEKYALFLQEPANADERRQDGGWRLLHESGGTGHYEMDLGEGYKLRSSFMLA